MAGLVLGSFSSSAGQAPRNTPRPLATPPVRILSGAEIISRADEVMINPIVVPEPVDRDPNPVSSQSTDVRDLLDRISRLEAVDKKDPAAMQKRMLLNLDVLTRAEQRSEALRKQLFEMIEKENTVMGRIEQIEFDIRPEMIERTLQLAGSMKPEEIRDNRRKSLAAERSNLQSLLSEIQSTRTNLNQNLQRSETLVEKLRAKLEKDIDDALLSEPDDE